MRKRAVASQLLIWLITSSALFCQSPDRIDRLMMLGETWGTLYLFHSAGLNAEPQLEANFESCPSSL